MAERSDLLNHHGGYGSCQAGLYGGKPAVILPTYSERLSNARRLSDAGAAEIVSVQYVSGRKHVNAEQLRGAVRRVIEEPSYARNAKRLGARLRSLGGAAKAAAWIEEFAMSLSGLSR